jgi:acetoacetyl-CoA synthetase
MTTPHPTPHPKPFFTPGPHVAARSRMADFAEWAARHRSADGVPDPTDYQALHRWSVTDLEGFWEAV